MSDEKKCRESWVDGVMGQAQVFASAWSLVGGPFDGGDGLENAEAEKANLRSMLDAAWSRRQQVPEGWMRDAQQLRSLAEHLENVGWIQGRDGDPELVDQGSAMAAECVRYLLSIAPSQEDVK